MKSAHWLPLRERNFLIVNDAVLFPYKFELVKTKTAASLGSGNYVFESTRVNIYAQGNIGRAYTL
jgi:hypothetical protein